MDDKKELDIRTLPAYEDVLNLVYKMLQIELNKQSLEQRLGYDLANCMRNMDHWLLSDKHKAGFDAFLMKLLGGVDRLSLLHSEVIETDEELLVFRAKYDELKAAFDIQMSRPAWKPGVTMVQVTEEGNSAYGKQYTVSKIYYSVEGGAWIVEVHHPNNRLHKSMFKHFQLGEING